MARPSGEGPRTGEVVAGRYRIERPLGEGGMAQVFQATDLAGGAPVALKILRREVAESPEAVRRLRQEGEVLSQLEHPAIVSVSTYGQLDSGQLFLAMELLEGETLRERLQREKRLDPEALAPVVAGIVAGLEAAHGAGVVHRDLKPDNVFLSRLPGRAGFQVKVLDFGISKVTGGDRLTRTGQVLGTPRYMAPEQLAAERDLDARVDVYALGVMIYEALAGRSPFLTSSPSDLIVAIVHGKSTPLRAARPDVPAELEAVVARAMARARAARFPTARALGEAFLGLAAPARSSGPVSPASPGTVALGAHDPGAPALPPAVGSALKPGTFSAFGAPAPDPGREATSTAPGRRAARGMKTAPSTPAVTPMPHGAPPEAVAARWEEGPGVAGESWADRSPGALPAAATPAAATPTAMAPGPVSDPSLRIPGLQPRRPRRAIVWALLAGALVGGAFVAWNATRGPAAEPPSNAGGERPALPDGVLPVRSPPGPSRPAPPARGAAPPPVEAPTPSAGRSPAARTRRADRQPRRADPPLEEAQATAPPPWTGSASAANEPEASAAPVPAYERALAARGRGDPAGCVAALGEAGATQDSRALRLEAECLALSGRRRDAAKTFEAFCRRYPTHRDIEEIRSLAEAYGGQCR